MPKKIYAATGNTQIPKKTQMIFEKYIKILNEKNYTVRTGAAKGVQAIFRENALHPEVVTVPEPPHKVYIHNLKYYSKWRKPCPSIMKNIHAREALIILGQNLDSLPEFLICWNNTTSKGGSSFFVDIAREYNIPIYNFYREEKIKQFEEEILNIFY